MPTSQQNRSPRGEQQKLLNEKKNASASVEDLQRQISDLQNNQQKAKQSQLAEAGEFKRCGRTQPARFQPFRMKSRN